MSEKEKTIAEAAGKLPAAVQEKFLDQITGAAIAMEFIKSAVVAGHQAEADEAQTA